MEKDEDMSIVSKNGDEITIHDIPIKYVNSGHKLILRLKDNYTEYDWLFKKIIDLENEEYTFDVGAFGYYECEIFDCENKLVFEESNTFLGAVNLGFDFKTPEGVIRSYINVEEEGFKEKTNVLVDKNEQVYFTVEELNSKIPEVFKDIVQNAQEFVYIQDPYFDYRFYCTMIEDLPHNLTVKVMYKKNEQLNIPPAHRLILIKRDREWEETHNGGIHDRFIVTKKFGYCIGISLNGVHKNKSYVNKIFNTSDFIKDFE